MLLDRFELLLCHTQGNIFLSSAKDGFDSVIFCKTFMKSEIASSLDKPYSHLQWAGEKYLSSLFLDQYGSQLKQGGKTYYEEALYWMGYTYRYWHIYTGEDSEAIVKIAPPSFMAGAYTIYHTFDCKAAIDRIKEGRLQGQ